MDIIADGPRLVLSGDLDGRSTSEFRDALHERLAAHDGDLVLEVGAVDGVDVTALRVVAASRRAGRSGRCIALRGASASLLRMLHLTRLIRFVEIEREPIDA